MNFKNVDLLGRAPRFTKRAELVYKGKVFAIENGYVATVDGVKVLKTTSNQASRFLENLAYTSN